MSWISDNYEKAALAGTLLIAVTLSYSGLQRKNAVEEDFNAVITGRGSNDASIENGDQVATAIASLQLKLQWTKAEVDGRPLDLFTGVSLFVDKNNLKRPVDLPNSPNVHPSIPNQWWIDHRIDPGFGDSPQRDEDADGFSNIEEFNAKTHPSDNRSHPDLIQKLVFISSESIEWMLRPSGFPTAADPRMNFEYNDTKKKRNKTDAAAPIDKGGLFFLEGDAKGRFRYLGFEQLAGADVPVDMIRIEDLKPNKKGTVYEIPANFRRPDTRKFSKFDRTATMSLEALGLNGQKFKVEELTDFALPEGAENKRFRLMEVNPDKIVVRETQKDGTAQLHEISKKP
jgi:hypothetical protein